MSASTEDAYDTYDRAAAWVEIGLYVLGAKIKAIDVFGDALSLLGTFEVAVGQNVTYGTTSDVGHAIMVYSKLWKSTQVLDGPANFYDTEQVTVRELAVQLTLFAYSSNVIQLSFDLNGTAETLHFSAAEDMVLTSLTSGADEPVETQLFGVICYL